jgi:SAM-dependent methyltransferase
MEMETMTPEPSSSAPGFTDLDHDAAREHYFAFLDQASRHPSVRAYKEDSFAALGPTAGAQLLDVGCGLGDDSCALAAQVGTDGRVVGVDSSVTVLERARERAGTRGLPVEFRAGSIYALPFADETFDGVRADRIIHFLGDPARAIAELARVARAGGRVVVCEPDHDTLVIDGCDPDVTRRLLEVRRRSTASFCPGRSLQRLLADAGLTDVETRAHAGLVPELAIADQLLGLTGLVGLALKAAAVTATEALSWLETARAQAERGRFLAAMTVFTAAALRPRSTGARS